MTDCSDDDDDRDIDSFVLPHEYKPGSDLISRVILTDQRIINIVTKSLIEAPENAYAAAPTEFMNRNLCDVLYIPHATLNTLPPIIIEIQKNVDEKFMVRAIRYCTSVFENYKKLPVIVVLGISNVTMPVFSLTVPCVNFSFAKEITSHLWAQLCLLISSSTLTTLPQSVEQLHPLAALGLFMCSQALSINMLDYGKHDNTIKLLYTIAQKKIKQFSGEEDEKLEGISNICDNTYSQLEKIKQYIDKGDQDSFEKAVVYVDDASEYLRRQKRKYTTAKEATPIPETPPLKYLKKKQVKPMRKDSKHYQLLYEYVERFRSEKSGRISWKVCFSRGHHDDIKVVKEYSNSESLRAQYNKHFGNFKAK